MALGVAGGIGAPKIAALGAIDLSTSTFGAGMIVGARIGIAAIVGGLVGWAMMPYFISIGWLQAERAVPQDHVPDRARHDHGRGDHRRVADPLPRLAALARRSAAEKAVEQEDWKRTNTRRLVAWVVFWGICIVVVGSQVLHQPVGYLVIAVLLVFVFALVNGISLGITDSNPDFLGVRRHRGPDGGASGLRDPIVGLMAATVLLVSTSEACDMQQDRSTGWRLGTNRTIQFRFQVAGIVMGAIMAVVFAKLFMSAYPVLGLDQTTMPADQQPAQWTSAMTYKFVGVLRSLTDDKPYQRTAIWIGILIGFVTEFLRKYIKSRDAYQAFVKSGRVGLQHRLRARCRRASVAVRVVVRRIRQPADVGVVRRRRRAVELRQQPAEAQGQARCVAERHEHDLAGRRRPDRRRRAGGAGLGHRGTARHFVRLTPHPGGAGGRCNWYCSNQATVTRRPKAGAVCRTPDKLSADGPAIDQ